MEEGKEFTKRATRVSSLVMGFTNWQLPQILGKRKRASSLLFLPNLSPRNGSQDSGPLQLSKFEPNFATSAQFIVVFCLRQ
jgi:hypothetical protein